MKIIFVFLIGLTFLLGCSEETIPEEGIKQDADFETAPLIPIQYDFENLNLYLNSSIYDSTTNINWKWDYMNSDNGIPDTSGIEYYNNFEQKSFFFKAEETLPALFVTTFKAKIIEFSASTLISYYPDDPNWREKALDSLVRYDLLKDNSVKQVVLDSLYYSHSSSLLEESLSLTLPENDFGWANFTYTVRNKDFKAVE